MPVGENFQKNVLKSTKKLQKCVETMRAVSKCDGVIDDMLSAAGKCVKSAKT